MQVQPIVHDRSTALDQALIRTVAYADVFDYPLTIDQLWRYLVGMRATPAAIQLALNSCYLRDVLDMRAGFVVLAGRSYLIAQRQERAERARQLWTQARLYGARLAQLPFVRMVAVTGALAMDNVAPGADIDYLIVTEPGRLWLCRTLTIMLVRMAQLAGQVICPNYLISERALVVQERSLYTAHELAQMVPLAGMPIYRRMRALNCWVDRWLPNASQAPEQAIIYPPPVGRAGLLAEAVLPPALGRWLEQSAMERTIRRLIRRHGPGAEVAFGPDWCKGHFAGHGSRIRAAYHERLQRLNLTATPLLAGEG